MHKPVCRKCGCEMELLTDGQMAGAAVGGAVGATAGLIGSKAIRNYMEAGEAIGECIPLPGGGQLGAAVGALLGAATGFLTGAAIGSEVGRQVDQNIIRKYCCPNCGATATA